jgi:hypothetical protein
MEPRSSSPLAGRFTELALCGNRSAKSMQLLMRENVPTRRMSETFSYIDGIQRLFEGNPKIKHTLIIRISTDRIITQW